jgi:hypothetical protein
MTEALDTPILTLQLLFTTAKGSAALVAFLKKTKIATASWLLAAGALLRAQNVNEKIANKRVKE